MAKWGSADFRQLQRLQKKMEKLSRQDFDKFCKDCAKELAARLLAKVIKRTPVGIYPASSGKKGGTLRRGWTAGQNSKAFVHSLSVRKSGNMYELEVINPINYASYVEYGHRTRNHKGWVKGRFMMTISAKEVESAAPKIIEKKLMKYLGELFDD